MTSSLAHRAPRLLDRISEAFFIQGQLGSYLPSGRDNLYSGMSEGEIRGDYEGRIIRPSLYTRAALHPAIAAAVVGLAVIGIRALLSQHWRQMPRSRERTAVRMRGPSPPGRMPEKELE